MMIYTISISKFLFSQGKFFWSWAFFAIDVLWIFIITFGKKKNKKKKTVKGYVRYFKII